jgi:peptidyl-prolyl cis-trans isomerase D
MFDFVRTHSRLMLGLMVLLIFPSFVFFGVQGYTRYMEDSARSVASVDGRDITRGEWDAAHQRSMENMRRQMPGVDPKLLDSPEARRATLDNLIRERMLASAASHFALLPGDDRLQRIFATDAQFAGLRNPDGSVNRDILAAQGMNSEIFTARLRQDLGSHQVLLGVGSTAFAPQSAASAALGAFFERREVQVQRFEASSYAGKVTPSDAELEAFHKKNEAKFRAPEQATIEYVVLDLETIARGVAVKEEELRKYYEENASRYTAAQERRASHILINAAADANAADKGRAKARAQELLDELRKSPKSFADLAKKHSQDAGSAERGGDLDFFGRGAMTRPFEDAVFAMKEGEISNLVETEFGYHIIQLTSVRGGEKKSFESVRGEIEEQLRRNLAQKDYAAAAEQFTNTVYEQSDSLQPVIDRLKLEKRTAKVQRTPAPGATGALGSAKLLEAVFANDAVKNKRNTDAVEVGANQLAAARVVEHKPARALPLAEVRDQVRQQLVAESAAAMARKDGEARLAEVQKAGGEGLPPALTLSREQPAGQPRAVVEAALKADPAKLPSLQGVLLDGQGYAVLRVTKVLGAEAQAVAGERAQQYARALAEAETEAYLDALKARFKVKVVEDTVREALRSTDAASAAR